MYDSFFTDPKRGMVEVGCWAGRTVAEVFAEEQLRLLPPPLHPFTTDRIETVRSGKTIYIRFDLNDYSIPPEAVGRPLTLVASDTTVRILDGATAGLQLGNGWWESTVFNARLQAETMGLGTSSGATDQWRLDNIYSATQNNGNVQQQKLGLPGTAPIWESYDYDLANRLTTASEYGSSKAAVCPDATSLWYQKFGYDGPGNRTQTGQSGITPSVLTPASFDPANNRINAGGWAYDARGNLKLDALNRTFVYDSENRQLAMCTQDPGGCVDAAGAGRTRYRYDAEGRRVKKIAPDGAETVYVYDAEGQLAGFQRSLERSPKGSASAAMECLSCSRRDFVPFLTATSSSVSMPTAAPAGLRESQ